MCVLPSFRVQSVKQKSHYVKANKEWLKPTSIKLRVRWCVSTTETLSIIEIVIRIENTLVNIHTKVKSTQ